MREGMLIVATLLAASPLFAQGQSWPNKAFGGKPEAAVQVSMGEAPRGAKLVQNLQVTNIWNVPITITNIKVSCGCTQAATPALNVALPPGQSAPFTISVDGTRYEKPVQVTVTVATSKTTSTANLIVSANFHNEIALIPTELRFDSAKRGQSAERSLEVEYSGKGPWKLIGLAVAKEAPFEVKSEPLPPRRVNGVAVTAYRVTASLKPDAPLGNFRSTIELKTSDPKSDITFPIAGSIVPAVEAFPNPVAIANLQVKKSATTKVVIAGAEPFAITGFVCDNKDVTVILPGGAPAVTHIVDIQVTPDAAGRLSREVVLQTSLRNETVKIVVQGNVN